MPDRTSLIKYDSLLSTSKLSEKGLSTRTLCWPLVSSACSLCSTRPLIKQVDSRYTFPQLEVSWSKYLLPFASRAPLSDLPAWWCSCSTSSPFGAQHPKRNSWGLSKDLSLTICLWTAVKWRWALMHLWSKFLIIFAILAPRRASASSLAQWRKERMTLRIHSKTMPSQSVITVFLPVWRAAGSAIPPKISGELFSCLNPASKVIVYWCRHFRVLIKKMDES